jgi:5-methylcytosine-specific restriction endonuclease McrA
VLAKWQKAGYKKKNKCELCGFKAVIHQQLNVYHIDGNRSNVTIFNLKTICANCQRLKSTQDLGWTIGDLEVDE